ncbi:hypothetical protein [Pseudomonas putida]|uniref:hypothetical protein n=1 Tax=Pseudomonas putida TaxID=303 RepID=UPI003D98B66D
MRTRHTRPRPGDAAHHGHLLINRQLETQGYGVLDLNASLFNVTDQKIAACGNSYKNSYTLTL